MRIVAPRPSPLVRLRVIPFYLGTVSIIGLLLMLHGLVSVVGAKQPLLLVLLTCLIIVTTITSIPVGLNERIKMTYQIDSAIALASVPLYGPTVASLLLIISSLILWLTKLNKRAPRKEAYKQLLFNAGMVSISCAVAGHVFNVSQMILADNAYLLRIVPWLTMSIVFELVNHLLLGIIFRLQNGATFNILQVWKSNSVIHVLGITINMVGAAFIAYALREVGWEGIVVFFLPVITSAYAFHSYVKRTEKHMHSLEHIVDERTKALQQLNKEKNLFLAVLAHDMKSPLTSIYLYGRMIRKRPYLAADKPCMVQSIIDSQQELLELVNNILDLERLDEGNEMNLDREHFDLRETFELLANRMEAQASAKSIELRFNYDNEFVPIHGDRTQIGRVFGNLISNAIKYTPENGTVTVHVEQNEENMLVTVEDTGYGIPADAIDTLFDRYSRVEKHRDKAVGTGLGLSITKAIVDAHNGEIAVVSKEHVGTTFIVTLPITHSCVITSWFETSM